MNAAVVNRYDAPPVYAQVADPTAALDETMVTMSAVGLSQLVRAQAAGKHYSSQGKLPFFPGNDGVGTTPDGRRVYFAFPRPPHGSMAERVPVPTANCVPVPDGLDDVMAAALANPGMSSWAALAERARLTAGEVVLINGATGTSGRLAVQIAKHLGAGRVIATGRNRAVLDALTAVGADAVVPLEGSADQVAQAFRTAFAADGGVNVVLDYLWGPSAEQILAAIAAVNHGQPRVRFVQIGSVTGQTIAMPAAVLRSSGLELLGSGLGSVPTATLIGDIGRLLAAAGPAKLRVDVEPVPLSDVAAAWTRDAGQRRVVFTV